MMQKEKTDGIHNYLFVTSHPFRKPYYIRFDIIIIIIIPE